MDNCVYVIEYKLRKILPAKILKVSKETYLFEIAQTNLQIELSKDEVYTNYHYAKLKLDITRWIICLYKCEIVKAQTISTKKRKL